MARTVVVSPQALEGIDALPGEEVLLADGAAAFRQAVLLALQGRDLGPAARQRVLQDYTWGACLAGIEALMEAEHTAVDRLRGTHAATAAADALVVPARLVRERTP